MIYKLMFFLIIFICNLVYMYIQFKQDCLNMHFSWPLHTKLSSASCSENSPSVCLFNLSIALWTPALNSPLALHMYISKALSTVVEGKVLAKSWPVYFLTKSLHFIFLGHIVAHVGIINNTTCKSFWVIISCEKAPCYYYDMISW